mmetsp:Transcript_52456/g.132591  ORF Transcript_52456/g.132591 Transcript_52456/m.132591 type:complete len:259 (+) Transcript_52456:204-980(+)
MNIISEAKLNSQSQKALPKSAMNLLNSKPAIHKRRFVAGRGFCKDSLRERTHLTIANTISTKARINWQRFALSSAHTGNVPAAMNPSRSIEQMSSLMSAAKLQAMLRKKSNRTRRLPSERAAPISSKCFSQRNNLNKRRACDVPFAMTAACLPHESAPWAKPRWVLISASKYAANLAKYCNTFKHFSRDCALDSRMLTLCRSRSLSHNGKRGTSRSRCGAMGSSCLAPCCSLLRSTCCCSCNPTLLLVTARSAKLLLP